MNTMMWGNWGFSAGMFLVMLIPMALLGLIVYYAVFTGVKKGLSANIGRDSITEKKRD